MGKVFLHIVKFLLQPLTNFFLTKHMSFMDGNFFELSVTYFYISLVQARTEIFKTDSFGTVRRGPAAVGFMIFALIGNQNILIGEC